MIKIVRESLSFFCIFLRSHSSDFLAAIDSLFAMHRSVFQANKAISYFACNLHRLTHPSASRDHSEPSHSLHLFSESYLVAIFEACYYVNNYAVHFTRRAQQRRQLEDARRMLVDALECLRMHCPYMYPSTSFAYQMSRMSPSLFFPTLVSSAK